MTCPRELSLQHGRLYQRPARELQQLRGERAGWQGHADDAPAYALGAAELQLTPQGAFSAAFGDAMTLSWDGERLQLTRASWPTVGRSTVTGAARSPICSCCSIVPAWKSSSTTARR